MRHRHNETKTGIGRRFFLGMTRAAAAATLAGLSAPDDVLAVSGVEAGRKPEHRIVAGR